MATYKPYNARVFEYGKKPIFLKYVRSQQEVLNKVNLDQIPWEVIDIYRRKPRLAFARLKREDFFYIDFLNSKRKFETHRYHFQSIPEAEAWGRENLDNFHMDQVKLYF